MIGARDYDMMVLVPLSSTPLFIADVAIYLQVPKEKFERDLGEGRKLQVDSSTTKNNSTRVSAGGRGTPSDSADARDEPDVKRTGGGLPGISKSLPKSSTSAPISNGPGR